MDHGRLRNSYTCKECIWFDQCFDDEVCDHFSSFDDSLNVTYYENGLKMCVAEYQDMIDEYSDGNVTYDGF